MKTGNASASDVVTCTCGHLATAHSPIGCTQPKPEGGPCRCRDTVAAVLHDAMLRGEVAS